MDGLKPGQIIIIKGANLITQLQGDTSARHVCQVAKDPTKIWTTGASGFPFYLYGQVDAERYLRRRGAYILADFVVPLTEVSLDQIEATHEAMQGRFYGFNKYPLMMLKALRKGKIDFLGKVPRPELIFKRPICSQAVGAACWNAGIHIGEWQGKQDATGLIPENFEDEVDRGVLLKQVN